MAMGNDTLQWSIRMGRFWWTGVQLV